MARSVTMTLERIKTGDPGVISFRAPFDYMIRDELRELIYYQEHKKRRSSPTYTITMRTPYKPRSTGKYSQCSHFNGHVQQICDETGNDFEDVKMYLKRKALRRGYPFKTDEDGNIMYSIIDGEPLPQNERDASVEDSILLIEEAHQLAAGLGIRLKERNEDRISTLQGETTKEQSEGEAGVKIEPKADQGPHEGKPGEDPEKADLRTA